MKSQQLFKTSFSCEFFPPKTDQGMDKLQNVSTQLRDALKPEYFSVTFGAGGSTRDRTFEAVKQIKQASGVDVAPHLSCIGSTRSQLADILNNYKSQDIKRIVALRGDIPSGMVSPGDFNYANELVNFIREEHGDHFHIEVAAYPEFHPQAETASQDLQNFKRKVEAGANSAITQYFFNPDAYFQFVDDCLHRGVGIPITPGIMPITNYKQLARFSDACGAEIPRWIRKRLESYGDDLESIREFGLDVVTHLCEQLLDGGAPGLHFYSMNRAEPVKTIWNDLKLSD